MLTSRQIFKLRMDCSKIFPYTSKVLLTVPISCEDASNTVDVLVRVFGYRVIFSKKLIEEYTYEQIKAAFLHACCYIILKHNDRGKNITSGKEDYMSLLWFIASELSRTEFLQMMDMEGVDLSIFLSAKKLGFPPGLAAEQYFDLLTQQQDVQDSPSLRGDLSNAHHNATSSDADATQGGGTEVSDTSAAMTDETGEVEGTSTNAGGIKYDSMEEQIHETVKDIVSAAQRGIGSNNGEVRSLEEKFYPGRFNLVKRIRNLILSIASGGPGRWALTGRPRRKRLPGIEVMAEQRQTFGRVAVIVDVSGSTAEYRQQVFDGLALVIRATQLVDVFIGDTTILLQHKRVKRTNQILGLPDGGGTDMASIMKSVDSGEIKYYSIIVVTDGITAWPSKPLRAKTFVIPIGAWYDRTPVPNWITVLGEDPLEEQ